MAEELGKTAIVTGGASGIGLETTRLLAENGWKVVALDRNAEALDVAGMELAAFGDSVRFTVVDVSDETQVADTIGRVSKEFGPIGAVVNSAGFTYNLTLLETTLAHFQQMLAVNLIGTFLVSREAVRNMTATGGGAIVNVASVGGVRGSPGRVAYAASKGGMVAITRSMAVELAPAGIRVNAVAPGPVETPLSRRMHSPETRANILSAVPLHRYCHPREVAQVIDFLLDEEKSGFVTGQILPVDGGVTASAGYARF